MNNDNSIGIEVVGNYDDKTKTWDALTPEQVESTAQAIHVIAKKYGVDRDKVLPHESVSAKTAGEGGEVLKSVKDRLDEIWKKREK